MLERRMRVWTLPMSARRVAALRDRQLDDAGRGDAGLGRMIFHGEALGETGAPRRPGRAAPTARQCSPRRASSLGGPPRSPNRGQLHRGSEPDRTVASLMGTLRTSRRAGAPSGSSPKKGRVLGHQRPSVAAKPCTPHSAVSRPPDPAGSFTPTTVALGSAGRRVDGTPGAMVGRRAVGGVQGGWR